MSDPVNALLPLFRESLSLAFSDELAGTDPMLRASKYADFQANCALPLAKILKRAPREVASALLERLPHAAIIERAEVSGPGFINLWLSRDYLAKALAEASADLGLTTTETPETVVVDYSSPNVAKE